MRGLRPASASLAWEKPGVGVEALVDGRRVYLGSPRGYSSPAITEALGRGLTPVAVAEDGELIGVIGLEDELKEESRRVVSELRGLGLLTVMLTGDTQQAAERVAREVGVDTFKARALPEDKALEVEALRSLEHIAMAGDGVNDAPALAKACVGIAVSTGSLAAEAGDIVLASGDIAQLPYIIKLSKGTTGIVKQNIAASISAKAALATLAALGKLTLWLTVALGDVGLTLLVTLNSLRLLNSREGGLDSLLRALHKALVERVRAGCSRMLGA